MAQPRSGGLRDSGPIVLAFLFATASLLVRALSVGIPDTGDAVAHYQHARYSWMHHDLWLNAWAKPVFTLLASPFAQIGLWGTALFTALCAVATAWIIIGFVGRVNSLWSWAVPVLLFFAPQYAFTVMSGLTEPLFGLLAVVSVVLMLNKRWSFALAIASFLPYTRPEHIALIPFMVGFTLLHRKWRALPWIALGTVVYAIASAIVFHDPLKVLLSDPYTGVDVYGTGPAMHFVDRMDEIIGVPLKWATLIAGICWPVLWWKDRERRSVHLGVLLLTLLPALAILCIHSYAWWKGGHGSLGLLRVLATGVPLIALFVTHVIASLWELFVPERRGWSVVGALVFITYGSFAYADFRDQLPLPFQEDPVQRTELLAAPVIKEKLTGDTRLYMLDPYLLALCDVDPWNSDKIRLLYGMGSLMKGGSIRPGDLVVWDGHFCQNEGGVPLDSLLLGDRFEPLMKFAPEEKPIMLGGMAYEIDLFRFAPAEHLWTRDTLFVLGDHRHFPYVDRIDSIPSVEGHLTVSAAEYPMGFRVLPVGLGSTTAYEDLIIRGELRSDVPTKQEVLFVFTESEGEKQVSYLKKALAKGAFEWRVQVIAGLSHRTNKLYLWNRTGQPVDFARLEVIHERVRRSAK